MVLDGDFQIAGLQTFLHRAFNAANKRFNNLPRWILRIDGTGARFGDSFGLGREALLIGHNCPVFDRCQTA